MTTQSKPYPVVEYLIGIFGDWLNHRRELNDLRQLDTRRVSTGSPAICGYPPPILNELVRRDRMQRMNCRSCSRRSASTRRPWSAPSHWCCATWSASAACATTSANATATSPPAPPPGTISDIASTPPRSTTWASRSSIRTAPSPRPANRRNFAHHLDGRSAGRRHRTRGAFVIRLHNASGATPLPTVHRLAEAWCKERHAIDAIASAIAIVRLAMSACSRSTIRPSIWIAPREAFSGCSNAAMILRASATSSAGGVKIALQASI